ncbi:hypothetical protein [Laspinema palackyanum]|uniref:hypothetical protein n=1 Tax=Laspinema palackyanum TaxID=3231601 RepID=UPI00349F6F86
MACEERSPPPFFRDRPELLPEKVNFRTPDLDPSTLFPQNRTGTSVNQWTGEI